MPKSGRFQKAFLRIKIFLKGAYYLQQARTGRRTDQIDRNALIARSAFAEILVGNFHVSTTRRSIVRGTYPGRQTRKTTISTKLLQVARLTFSKLFPSIDDDISCD